MKCPVRVKIDLTKKRHNLLVSANKYVSNIDSVKFCYADINCRLKIKWEDESMNDTFFHSLTEMKSHVNSDENYLHMSVYLRATFPSPPTQIRVKIISKPLLPKFVYFSNLRKLTNVWKN